LSRPLRASLLAATIALGGYLLLSYVAMPLDWRVRERRHPALQDAPQLTFTKAGIPGDPLNLSLVGSESDIQRAMVAASWFPADPITLKSALRITAATVAARHYDDAPVSSLYLWGRKQDLAFEQPSGGDPRRRHHVRLWRAEKVDEAGTELWMGAATYDTRVGLSHTTGQITHHIAADVDTERDKLIGDLSQSGGLRELRWVDGFHVQLSGKNGGGDPWKTDGRLAVGTLKTPPSPADQGR
jgi:hypothetical protein